jgi:undecaprenyl-phosphate galactose phosphotransferase/putative colanic acid biosynthesis UDP-glucose lipid carrier transferase
MAIAAVCIKLDSAGPVIFTQTRIGFNNRAFRIYKFRTLRTLEDGPILKQVTQDDPRMTRCGRFLRQFSIDEMPQLLNVLRGEMSLVGPRPHAVAHNSQYASSIVNYAFRHHVKPGLTGWAQIHGLRGETRTLAMMQRRIDFDMWYVNNWSLWLDIKITMRTIVEVVRYALTDELRKDTAT